MIKILKWIPAVFIAGCNFYLSSQERIELMPSFWNADKLVHFICFAGFGFWVAFACNISSFKKIWLPSLIVSLWAITDEIHQSLIPGRTASVFDWIADTTGAALGTVVFVWLAAKFVKALQKRRN